MSEAIKLFISYSHQDKKWMERVQVHLKPLTRNGLIDCWDDTCINAGDRWQDKIVAGLNGAQVAILLVSPYFYASDFIAAQELPPLLKKAENEGTRILILVLDHCRFERDPALNCFQAVHEVARPLNGLSESDQNHVLDKLTETIERLVRTACEPSDGEGKLGTRPHKVQKPFKSEHHQQRIKEAVLEIWEKSELDLCYTAIRNDNNFNEFCLQDFSKTWLVQAIPEPKLPEGMKREIITINRHLRSSEARHTHVLVILYVCRNISGDEKNELLDQLENLKKEKSFLSRIFFEVWGEAYMNQILSA